jgi:hypothetical protein
MLLDDNATVAQRVEAAPGLVILRVVSDKAGPVLEPGQYTVLGLNGQSHAWQGRPRLPVGAGQDDPIRRALLVIQIVGSHGSFLSFGLKDRVHQFDSTRHAASRRPRCKHLTFCHS